MPEAAIRIPAHHFDDLPCAVAVVSDGGRLMDVNLRLTDMVGRPREALLGQPVNRLFSQAGALLYHTYVAPQVALHGRVDEVSVSLSHAHGGLVDVLFGAQREVVAGAGWVRCVFLPLQARKQLEQQLLTAKRVADAVPGVLFQFEQDRLGRLALTYTTDAIQDLFEVSPTQAFCSVRSVWRRLHRADARLVWDAWRASAGAVKPWSCEFRVRLSAGEGWREVHASPRREPDGRVIWSGCVTDVTERKRMEGALRDKAAAEQANQAKSAFLSRLSHELRTPLNGILGFSQLLREHDASNLREDQLKKLNFIEVAGSNLLKQINEVLDISRIEAGQIQMVMASVPLDTVIAEAVQLIEPMAAQRGATLVWPPGANVIVRADVQRLGQVLLNLLSNAVKYGGAGIIKIEVVRTSRGVDLSVQDQGPGLSAAQQAQLFQPFNRLGAERGAVEGVGLGLVITRSLVELMGGQLCLESEPGRGCRFTVELLAVDEEPVTLIPGDARS